MSTKKRAQRRQKLIPICLAVHLALTPTMTVLAQEEDDAISSDLTGFFNSIGANANVTGPSAFEGQTRNVATGGSLYVRMPQRSYNLANLQLPAARAGCGGIDLFAGSFSYINAEQFAAMIRNIGNSALGYAFQLAIDAVDPMIGNVLDKMRKASELMNNLNINSCEAGQALVNGIVGKTNLAAQQGCASLSAYLNLSEDRPGAMGRCSDPIQRRETADAVRNDPDARASAPLNIISGNLMARVLETAYPWMTDAEKMLLISMTGTMIIDNPDEADGTKARIRRIPPSITSEQDIVAGIQGAADADRVLVPLLTCIDPDSTDCDEATPTPIASLKHMVDQRLTEYQALMEVGETDWTEAQRNEMISFISVATVPVLQMLRTEMSFGVGLKNRYIELIAAQYAIFWLESMVRMASGAVANYPSLGPEEAEEMDRMRSDLLNLQSKLKTNLTSAAEAAAATTQIAKELKEFDVTLRMNDTGLAQAVQLSRSLGAGGTGASAEE